MNISTLIIQRKHANFVLKAGSFLWNYLGNIELLEWALWRIQKLVKVLTHCVRWFQNIMYLHVNITY